MSVCSCQMPALCSTPTPPSTPFFPLCVCERKKERERGGGISFFTPVQPGWGVVCCVLVLHPHCLCNWLVRMYVSLCVSVNGPAIVLSDCWNAVEWWLCQPRCPAVLCVFVVVICVWSFFVLLCVSPLTCLSAHRSEHTVCMWTKSQTQCLASGKLIIYIWPCS